MGSDIRALGADETVQDWATVPVPIARPSMPNTAAILPYLERIDGSGWYTNFGPLILELEQRLAERFDGKAYIATASNGTQALTIALQALGVTPGGVCIMPAWTFVASAHAVRQAGLSPWFVDVDPVSWTLDPDYVRHVMAEAPGKVEAVMVVAAFGQPVDVSAWVRFREETGVPVILDAAASFDTVHDPRLLTMVSLHATKVLGSGEGAFIVSEDYEFIARFRASTNFGFHGDRIARHLATNAKLSEYNGAVSLAALDVWPQIRSRYVRCALALKQALSDVPDIGFQPGWGEQWVSSTCVVSLPSERVRAVIDGLASDNIASRSWWALGCHREPAFIDCPSHRLVITDQLAATTLGLPYFADMDGRQIDRLAHALQKAMT
jgi:dTDP-4-amino-4,6-dideoxygalactose transaminase